MVQAGTRLCNKYEGYESIDNAVPTNHFIAGYYGVVAKRESFSRKGSYD